MPPVVVSSEAEPSRNAGPIWRTMRRMRIVLIVAMVLGVGFACGGSGGGGSALDCAWLASDNCWKMTADEATACLPPTTEAGVLSADGKTCTYASGTQVTFTPALVLPIPDNADWNFTITKAGADCLHFENTQAGIKLVVSGHTVNEGLSGPTGLRIACPDGTAYANANAFSLLDCNADAGASFGGLPGNTWATTSTSVSVGLIGTSEARSRCSTVGASSSEVGTRAIVRAHLVLLSRA